MLNLSICITLSRILLTPVIIFYMVHGLWHKAFVWFMIAALTDLLDGFVARFLQQSTKLGQILDPIADKILLGGVMGAVLWLHASSLLFKAVLFFLLFKELILLVGGAILWFGHKRFIAPSVLSRAVSFCEIILVIALFGLKTQFSLLYQQIIFGLMVLNVALSCWLLVRYLKIVQQ